MREAAVSRTAVDSTNPEGFPMRIVIVRRISQVFFFMLFCWFCVVSSLGTGWMQLSGWPVSWFLELDPLNALGTVLTTGTLYSGLAWALVTLAGTFLLGRFFCGWVCPFGAIHHFVGFLGRLGKGMPEKTAVNRYRSGQSVKYYILFALLTGASAALAASAVRSVAGGRTGLFILAGTAVVLGVAAAAGAFGKSGKPGLTGWSGESRKSAGILPVLFGAWAAVAFFCSADRMIAASLQTGLLDPIPLVYRSVNLFLLPLADSTAQQIFIGRRFYDGAWTIAAFFLALVLLNLKVPRFYCRFVCPLGALFGLLGRTALWRIGRREEGCTHCSLCEANCEGACEPSGSVRIPECVLCMNCLDDCRQGSIVYSTARSEAGEVAVPDLSRRGVIITLASGVVAVPMMRLGGITGRNWNPDVIRPPGALAESEFLARCIKCGQCMRVCPTNVIQPAGFEAGLEGLWTPVLNYRAGTSGCQLNCVACGHICPTAAIRPLSLDEKLGMNGFAGAGRMRIGTAFVDRGRCLPWAMDRPCIVCQETCPLSPKAIYVRKVYTTVHDGVYRVKKADALTVELFEADLSPGRFATGDYFVKLPGDTEETLRRISENNRTGIVVGAERPFVPIPPSGTELELQVRLQLPQVDPQHCTGCGVCEHECPVSGRRAIRVTAENETRDRNHSLLLRRKPG